MRIRITNIEERLFFMSANNKLKMIFSRMSTEQRAALAKLRKAGLSVVRVEEIPTDKVRITFLADNKSKASVSIEDVKNSTWRVNSFDGVLSKYSKPAPIDKTIALAKKVTLPVVRSKSTPEDAFNIDRNILEASLIERLSKVGMPNVERIRNNRVADVALRFPRNSDLSMYRVYAYLDGVLNIISMKAGSRSSGVTIYSTKNFNNLVTKLEDIAQDVRNSKEVYV